MKRLLAVFVMLALPAAAQDHRPSAGAGGGNASGAKAGAGSSSGGSTAPSGGGNTGSSSGGSSGGGTVSRGSGGGSASSGGTRSSGGGEHAASGGSGVAVSRNPERGSYTNTGRHGDASAINGSGATASGSGATAAPRAAGTAADSAKGARTGDGNATGVPTYARPRTDQPVIGTAVPRGSVPPATGGIGGPIGPTGGVGYYYPWWWFGGAGLYGSYWGYNNYYGYPGYYGSGGYYGYSDPWFGGYPDAQDPMPSGGTSGGGWVDEGTLKLKIKPNTAEVYVDGFYVGVVDDFDGMFQKLHVEAGAHRIEVRAEGYEPLVFDVRITTDHATTYQGELKRIK